MVTNCNALSKPRVLTGKIAFAIALLQLSLATIASPAVLSRQPIQRSPQTSPDHQLHNRHKPEHDTTNHQDATAQAASVTPPARAENHRRKPNTEQNQRNQNSSEFWSALGVRMKPSEALLAASTFALFLATAWLVWITKDGSRRQLRAYLLVQGGGLTKGTVPLASVVIQNFGQTPAYDVQTWVGTKADDYPLKIPLPDAGAEFQQSKSIIGPGNTEESIVPVTQPTTAQWDLIRAEKASIYVWGLVRYRDAFKRKRVLRFRLMLNGDHAVNTGRFVNCEDGNYAD